MKQAFLLDTQAFIAAGQDTKLPKKVREILINTANTLYLSIVSIWEMQLKTNLGKLALPFPLREAVQRSVTSLGIELLPIRVEHIYRLDTLPFHHRDPFDRLLAAQALHEDIPVIGSDKSFDRYKISRLW